MAYPPPKVRGHGAEQLEMVCYATFPEAMQVVIQGQSLAGLGPRHVGGMAVFAGDGGFYLFTCDCQWQVMFDTWHESLPLAQRQAEYENPGITDLWKVT